MGKQCTIATVLKSQRIQQAQGFDRHHVYWLAEQVKKHLSVDHEFVCLTDLSLPGIKTKPLRHNLPGWWSKLELFEAFESAFYLDLDTVIVDDFSELVTYPHTFTALQDLSAGKKGIGSGLMAWNGDYSSVTAAFLKRHHHFMRAYTTAAHWGDQGFIYDHIPNIARFQSLFPGAIQSFKYDVKDKPTGKIVCFHGKPRPWHVQKDWIPVLQLPEKEGLC